MRPAVPLDAWQVGPWNRWAYMHVGELIATVPVPREDGRPWQLGAAAGDLDDLVGPLLEMAYVDGLAVLHEGARDAPSLAVGRQVGTRPGGGDPLAPRAAGPPGTGRRTGARGGGERL